MRDELSRSQMNKIRTFEKGFMATHLINIGGKLGLFQAIAEARDGLTTSDLATSLGLYEPYVRTWCETAYHFELLDADDHGRFTLQPFLDEILVDRSHFNNYLGNISVSVDIFGRFFADFPAYFKNGKAMGNLYTPEMSDAYYEATRNIHLVFQYMIIPKNPPLKDALEQGARVLDVGCGRGTLIIELAKLFTNSRFVGIDPNGYGIAKAEKEIRGLGLEDRVSVRNVGGEQFTDDGGFDVATMVANLHEIRGEIRRAVLSNVCRALKPEGQLLILDFPYPPELPDFRNPMHDFAILDQFRKTCVGNGHMTTYIRNRMLEEVGFKLVQPRKIGKGMFELITASKQRLIG